MIFSDHSGTEAVKGLRGDDAQAFVDVVDEVLCGSFAWDELLRWPNLLHNVE